MSAFDLLLFKRAVRRLVKAELEYAWKGTARPEDQLTAERNLLSARKNYLLQLGFLKEYINGQTR